MHPLTERTLHPENRYRQDLMGNPIEALKACSSTGLVATWFGWLPSSGLPPCCWSPGASDARRTTRPRWWCRCRGLHGCGVRLAL